MPVRGFFRWLGRLLSRRRHLKLGLVGAPNSGKTTLANRICMEFCGEELGVVSSMPHETRVVQSKKGVEVKSGGASLLVELFDTPGLSAHDDLWDYYRHFVWTFGVDEADQRFGEARRGITRTLALLGELDAVILVIDLERDPSRQISDILIDILDRQSIPIVIAANKIDSLKEEAPDEDYTFLGHPVVPISALHGTNMERLYKAVYKRVKP
ncbi:MAG: Era-like GTP-binding protein [Candidatus Altiarchaeota archaeon]|nr:Era-like GTP-binding protein [Candidatus Altiarchaeota archaeon]